MKAGRLIDPLDSFFTLMENRIGELQFKELMNLGILNDTRYRRIMNEQQSPAVMGHSRDTSQETMFRVILGMEMLFIALERASLAHMNCGWTELENQVRQGLDSLRIHMVQEQREMMSRMAVGLDQDMIEILESSFREAGRSDTMNATILALTVIHASTLQQATRRVVALAQSVDWDPSRLRLPN